MKVDRLVSIIMVLLDKKRIAAKDLADMFEVSKRTIYRDIDSINMAGIPVSAAPGVGGGFEITEEYKIDNKVFSTADLSVILTGLSGLSGMLRGDELANALAKVKSFIPAGRAKEIELKANQIFIDLSPWMGNRNIFSPIWKLLKQALRDKQAALLRLCGPLRKHNSADRRTLSTCAEKPPLVLAGVLPQEKGFPSVQALPHDKPAGWGRKPLSPRDYQRPRLDFTEMLGGHA